MIEVLCRGAWSLLSFRNIHDKILQHPDLDEASARAMATLKGVWAADWKPAPDARTPSRSVPAPAPITAARAASTSTSSSFFAMPLAPSTWNLPVFAQATSTLDDLEKYLVLPAVRNMDLDLLAWWKAHDPNRPEDLASGRPEGLPTLAKMARQYVGRPTSSAGVERMFSKAGRLHDDLKASQSDDTLEHRL